jgi:hypothetical protein
MGVKYRIRQNEIEEWLDLDLLKFSGKFIVSCRSEIFRHPTFQLLELFAKHSFELSYCKEDHLEIAAKYLEIFLQNNNRESPVMYHVLKHIFLFSVQCNFLSSILTA